PPDGRDAGDAFSAGVAGTWGTGGSSAPRFEFSRQAARASRGSPRHSSGSDSGRVADGARPSGCAGPSGSRVSPERRVGRSGGVRSSGPLVMRSSRGCAGSAPGGSAAQACEPIEIAPANAIANLNLLAMLRSVHRRREAADRSVTGRRCKGSARDPTTVSPRTTECLCLLHQARRQRHTRVLARARVVAVTDGHPAGELVGETDHKAPALLPRQGAWYARRSGGGHGESRRQSW